MSVKPPSDSDSVPLIVKLPEPVIPRGVPSVVAILNLFPAVTLRSLPAEQTIEFASTS